MIDFKAHIFGAALLSLGFAGSALADAIPYPNSGTENPNFYTFTANSTGDLIAYFYGSSASFDEQLGLLVNGVQRGGLIFDNGSTPPGTANNFGSVTAGDTLTFFINVYSHQYYSNVALNTDAINHVYSTSFSGDGTIPAGTYVAFEDLSVLYDGTSDYNYQDEQFVFTNTTTVVTSGVPEPSTWALMLLGFAGLGYAASRKAQSQPALLA